ncbi:MAG: hypothetical protein WC890_00695 [Candidatus Margulisiibacteriota bacterium]
MIGMLIVCNLVFVSLLGFALIVWIISGKEAGIVKLAGQIISVLLVVLVVSAFSYCLVKGDRMGHGSCGMCSMGKSCKMHSMDKNKMMKMHDKSMKMDDKGMKCKAKETK